MTKSSGWEYLHWILRSVAVTNLSTPDPRAGECVRSKDHVYFQASRGDNRYLSGGRDKGNWNVRTEPIPGATQFELRSGIDVHGRINTEPASPLDLTGCDWDSEWECYYDRYPDFAQGGYPRTQAWARSHYLTNGRREGRNCNC